MARHLGRNMRGLGLVTALLTGCVTASDDAPVDLTSAHVTSQAGWYSRYNYGAVVMTGGVGQIWEPSAEWIGAVHALSSDELSASASPAVWSLVDRVATGGDPHYAAPPSGDVNDWTDMNWLLVTNATSTEALAWTAMAEVTWARRLHVDSHYGVPGANDIPGAQQRFFGSVLAAEAFVQLLDHQTSPEAFDDDVAGHWALLAAAAAFHPLAAPESLPYSTGNRHAEVIALIAADALPGEDPAAWSRDLADALYAARPAPVTLRDHAAALYALPWYGAITPDVADDLRAEATALGDALLALTPAGLQEQAQALRGFTDAWRVTEETRYADAITTLLEAILADYDPTTGTFTSTTTYRTDLLADLFGALNAAERCVGHPGLDDALTGAFEQLVDASGVQQSAPTADAIPRYERLPSAAAPSELYSRWPTMPTPRQGDGEFGVAPVFAASVTWDPASASWTGIGRTFDTASAMHLATELAWFDADAVDGFPRF